MPITVELGIRFGLKVVKFFIVYHGSSGCAPQSLLYRFYRITHSTVRHLFIDIYVISTIWLPAKFVNYFL
jgi:hypothetical protein